MHGLQAIVREGAKAMAAGMNPMDLKRGVDRAVAAVVVEELKKRSKKITTPAETAYSLLLGSSIRPDGQPSLPRPGTTWPGGGDARPG